MTDHEIAYAKSRIAHCQAMRSRTQRSIDRIDGHGLTVHEAIGYGPMRDVTSQRRADLVDQINLIDECIGMWSRALP
jgi:hypothetical protein